MLCAKLVLDQVNLIVQNVKTDSISIIEYVQFVMKLVHYVVAPDGINVPNAILDTTLSLHLCACSVQVCALTVRTNIYVHLANLIEWVNYATVKWNSQ